MFEKEIDLIIKSLISHVDTADIKWSKPMRSKVKCSICISDYIQTTFFHLGRFLKKLADDQCCPNKVKMQYMHFRLHSNYFLVPWKIPEEISRRLIVPFKVKMQYLHFRFHVNYFLLPWKIPI